MKKLIAMVLMLTMVMGGFCLAAEWPEGRSAAQPYSGVPEVDLSKTIGYIILSPRAKMPAEKFCDALEIYLPREDVEIGKGKLKLYAAQEGKKNGTLVAEVDFKNQDAVRVSPMDDAELDALMWGSGSRVEILLPVSMELGSGYYVLMDKGCLTAADGKAASPAINNPEAWVPVLEGEYGVSRLRYYTPKPVKAPAEKAVELDPDEAANRDFAAEEEERAEAEAKAKEVPEAETEYKLRPVAGDRIALDVVLGGEAVSAVAYSDNGSVVFDQVEFVESGVARGSVVGEDVKWGVVFLDAGGAVIANITPTR